VKLTLRKYKSRTVTLGVMLPVFAFGPGFALEHRVPSGTYPMPLPIVYLALLGFGPLVIALPTLAFWAWCVPLFEGATRFPLRSIILGCGAGAASVAWFQSNQWQTSCWSATPVLSLVLFALTTVLAALAIKRPSFALNASAHFALFVWLFSFAFPYCGDLL
jgi:hypothetical protein